MVRYTNCLCIASELCNCACKQKCCRSGEGMIGRYIDITRQMEAELKARGSSFK